ncbi:MAG: chemotaxis protein CheW [Iphinoe sp. HA4291-MV1]|jgi:purine-binding chemotaxis protein CheW|nr:chemotaxis protein CheW [Iphinoe sp. HA4291-MV1]
MESNKYLTFCIHNLYYGIEAVKVQELFSIPELIPIVGDNDIIGTLNLHSQVVPVIHLNWLQGHSLQHCHFHDKIIVFQWKSLPIGILVHDINEMVEIDNEIIEIQPMYGFPCDIDTEFFVGIAKVESKTIFLLDSKKLVRQPDTLITLIWDAQNQLNIMTAFDDEQQQDEEYQQLQEEFQIPNFYDMYCPCATPEERLIFRQRAIYLKQSLEDSEKTNKLIPLAVIGISHNYYGLNLELVRKFTEIDNFTPIPGCPKHIVGNMNLHGEVITLIDIWNVLNLAITPVRVGSKAVVVQVDDIIAGLPVDEVLEVVYLNPAEMTLLPNKNLNNSHYFRGIAFFQEKILNVLDLTKILTLGELVVNEQI